MSATLNTAAREVAGEYIRLVSDNLDRAKAAGLTGLVWIRPRVADGEASDSAIVCSVEATFTPDGEPPPWGDAVSYRVSA
jgi:hypothetical protein